MMDLFDLIPFLGRSREKSVVDLMNEQISLVYESVASVKAAVDALTGGDMTIFEEKKASVNALEDRIDGITRGIEEHLYSGAFLAASRSRILDFAEDVDDIADAAKDAVNIGDVIVGYGSNGRLGELLRRHMEITLKCVGSLKACVESSEKPDRLPALIMDVRRSEHEVDVIAEELFHLVRGPDFDAKSFVLISEMIEFMNNISDRSEDACDTLSLVMLMHKP
ncbi:MAG: DUF47 family protein [Candidatus Altiarchaeota archaeon]|nr:DUF47 family protein [Candidatus Altiarchaeota archaeon]